jgi:Bacterial Ig-like domain (group 2)
MIRLTIALAGLTLLAACGSSNNISPASPVASVTISPINPTVKTARTVQLTAVALDSAGAVLSQALITWAVTDPTLATISAGGLVTGVAAGSTTVTASSGTAADTVPLTVTPGPPIGPPVSVTILPNPATVYVGDSLQLAATVLDSSGTILTGVTLGWSSGNSGTASVSASGMLHGVALGGTTVTVTAGTVSGQTSVTVAAQPTGSLHTVMSSYLGGSDEEMLRDITVDAQGNMYLVGQSASTNFPTTPGVLSPTFNCCGFFPHDATITKTTPSGSIIWSTYLGGINYERAYAVEVDAQGYVYATGRGGAGFPTTPGSFQPNFGGGLPIGLYHEQDAWICKIKPDGSAAVWCSYMGTSDNGILRDIAIDANGDVYVAGGVTAVANGQTFTSYPAAWFTNAYQKTIHGAQDLIIAKIKGDGSQVLWATYLGGSDREVEGVSLRLDSQGNVIVMDDTYSSDAPTTVTGYPSTLHGTTDLYIAKLSPDGSQLLYAEYLGGSGTESIETHGLWLDAQDNAFVTGTSTSTDIQTTSNAYQKTYGGGAGDDVIYKISPTGAILAATYVGGTGNEGPDGAGVDQQGNFYFAGNTTSPNFPLTVPSSPGAGLDLVGVKMSSDLSHLLFSIRYSGNGDDGARSGLVDAAGNFYLIGNTTSTNFPTLNAIQATYGGAQDGLIVKIAP